MDISQFVEVAAGFKTALESLNILKGLKGVSGDKAAQEELSRLQRLIDSAQQSAIAANLAQFDLIQQNRALEEKISRFETWEGEKLRYELRNVNPGRGAVFVWALKPEAQNTEPFHVLCAKCFEHRNRSILQAAPETRMGQRLHICFECKSEFVFGPIAQREPPARAITDFDPFAN
jgi:hypothetical protein